MGFLRDEKECKGKDGQINMAIEIKVYFYVLRTVIKLTQPLIKLQPFYYFDKILTSYT